MTIVVIMLEGQALVDAAEKFARAAHAGQKRWDGTPYITHPEAIAAQFNEPFLKAAAFLHDVAEDCYPDWETAYEALKKAGMPADVIAIVRHLTRAPGDSYADYIKHVARMPEAVVIKIADLEHNLSTLSDERRNTQRRDKYALALLYLRYIDSRLPPWPPM
jgi:(p)ppGpp synthase/HD superfamily hydrolase